MPPALFSYPTPFEFDDQPVAATKCTPSPSSEKESSQFKNSCQQGSSKRQSSNSNSSDNNDDNKKHQRRGGNQQHAYTHVDVNIPESPVRRLKQSSRGISIVQRSQSTDDIYGKVRKHGQEPVGKEEHERSSNNSVAVQERNYTNNRPSTRPPSSPGGGKRTAPVRSKSNNEVFFKSLLNNARPQNQQLQAQMKARPTLPKTKSGRFLPKPAMTRSTSGSAASNTLRGSITKTGNNNNATKKNFIRKSPGKTQSTGNLDSMRQSIYAPDNSSSLITPSPPRGKSSTSSLLPPPSPNKAGKSFSLIPPASPNSKGVKSSSSPSLITASLSRKKLWLLSPSQKKQQAAALSAASDLGGPPMTPTEKKHKPKVSSSLSQTVRSGNPTTTDLPEEESEDERGAGNKKGGKGNQKRKSRTFQQLLAKSGKKKQEEGGGVGIGRSSSNNKYQKETASVDAITNRTRARSMSPIAHPQKNNQPSRARKSMNQLPSINIIDDDDISDNDSLSPEPQKPASATGIVAGLWSTFNDSFRRDDDDSEGSGNELIDDNDRSLSSIDDIANEPASTSGLITGFIDKMYDSFMNEDTGNGNDDDDEYAAMMQRSISRLDRRINEIAGLH